MRCVEEYPSLVEGTGLENRKVVWAAQGFESLFLRHFIIIPVEEYPSLVKGALIIFIKVGHASGASGSNPFSSAKFIAG